MTLPLRLIILSVAILGPVAFATAAAAELGDPAPELAIRTWVQGDPVDLASGRGTNIYVIEFWATWCGPCRTSIPHLSKLQSQFKDQGVIIVGVSDERKETVEPFLKKLGKQMEYVVALDDKSQTFKNYMTAFNQGGIPHAFVIDRTGRLVWHGHPMAGLDGVLRSLVDGTFDLDASRRASRAEALLPDYFSLVSAPNAGGEANKVGRQIIEDAGQNADLLNQFAWLILTRPQIKSRDLDLALEAAKKACALTDGKDASALDTYARALFDTGQVGEAIATQEKAIQLCPDPEMKTSFEESLQRYRQGAKTP